MILFFFLQIEWQTVNRYYNGIEQELAVYLSIPSHNFKSVFEDSIFSLAYETQITIYDKKGNQLTGDYWETRHVKDTMDIRDSIKIIVPKNSDHFKLKIVDLHAGTILDTTGDIRQIRYVGNIRWDMINDTLLVTFTIINEEGLADTLLAVLDDIKEYVQLKKGVYDDSLALPVGNLPNGVYSLRLQLNSESQKIDEVPIPIRIARAFYLDKSTWQAKVEELEYIATSSEINKLKDAEKPYRDSLWREFWKQHDPTPNTVYNEKEVEYFERIEYAQEHFSHGDIGWRSDRGKVYVKFGTPDEIQSYPYYNPPKNPYDPIPTLYDSYLIWYYYKANRQFIFGDKYGLGQYILLNPAEMNL